MKSSAEVSDELSSLGKGGRSENQASDQRHNNNGEMKKHGQRSVRRRKAADTLKEPKLCVSQVVGRRTLGGRGRICSGASGAALIGPTGRLRNPIKLITAAEGTAKAVYLEPERRPWITAVSEESSPWIILLILSLWPHLQLQSVSTRSQILDKLTVKVCRTLCIWIILF